MTISEVLNVIKLEKQHISLLVKHDGNKYAVEPYLKNILCLNIYPYSVHNIITYFENCDGSQPLCFIPKFSVNTKNQKPIEIMGISNDATHVYLHTDVGLKL